MAKFKLQNLGEMVAGLTQNRQVDPSRFNDPVATKTGWFPLKEGGSNLHKLVQVDANRVQYQASPGSRVMGFLLLIAGLGGAIAYAAIQASAGKFSLADDWVLPAVGLGLAVVGACILFLVKPIVFDKSKGYFWKGKEEPDAAAKHCVELDRIHALQLISQYKVSTSRRSDGSMKSRSQYLYEMNLVLEDGERINVAGCAGKANVIRKEAEALSQFLGKPLWDAM